QSVNNQLLFLACSVGPTHCGLACCLADLTDLDACMDVETLLRKCLESLLGDLLIHGGQKLWHGFQDGHFGTKATPYTAHFQTDHASTDHAQTLGHSCHAQGT